MWKYDSVTGVQLELLKKRVIDLQGDVDNTMFYYVREALTRLAADDSPEITINITSSGGDVTAGLNIHDALRMYGGKKTGIVIGYARSMAVTILQACDVRIATKHAGLLVHHISQSSISLDILRNEKKTAKARANLEKIQKQLYEILMSKTHKGLKEVAKASREGKEMTADEALEFGLIDEIK